MNITAPTSASVSTATANQASGFSDLKSEDFIRLLVTQLTTQDPLEPVGNEELLQQISSIHNIELSSTLTDSLRTLTGQQRFTSASSLIGQFVTAQADAGGGAAAGTVTGVRFQGDGKAVLLLSDGTTLALENVATIESPLEAAQRLVGQRITGLDRNSPTSNQLVEGLATGVRLEEDGGVVLELDTGGVVRFRDVLTAQPVA